MLKGKSAIYILVPLNVVVWSFFAYRFYEAYSDQKVTDISSGKSLKLQTSQADSVVYELKLDYQDPFLKDQGKSFGIATKKRVYEKKEAKPVLKRVPVLAKLPPEIKYVGMVKNGSSGLTTALISVNGQSRLVKPNDMVEGIKFKTIAKDSLVARWGKEKIVVKR